MIDQTFSARNLLRLTTRLDPKKYRLGRKRADYLASLEKISAQILSDDFTFSNFSTSHREGKPVYSVTSHVDEFALRKLSDNLSRIYGVRQANRTDIIGQVIPLLKEKIPFSLLKFDIKSFYESVNRISLLQQIDQDSLLSFRSKSLLNQLLRTDRHFPGTGLPRGINLSATLSEFYMKDFDSLARNLSGIYFYVRFVDDILIFTYSDPAHLKESLQRILPIGMRLNDSKERLLGFDRNGNCIRYEGAPEISYLGYRFVFRPVSAAPQGKQVKGTPPPPPRLTIKIAETKLLKIKRRIMLSIFSFFQNKDASLLKDRIRFLTGNCQMKRDADNGRLFTGIYYNYSHIDESGIKELQTLTKFMRSAILSKKGAFGIKMQSYLTREDRRILISYCFEAGFRQKITHKSTPERLKQIKECWRHA
ncbi:antiviral reverse transcriptase Drt3a [Pandoraea pnomenusa]|uniref:antiviral reverse transcriptase Drt3a n=1 Tax=Pandoraea pnomenusa TaxID=93220 RepID=UPI0009BEBDEB|nr:antiviral reverse transcriptase Drt3a [Pandoraea pnomenusa]